MTVQAQSGGKDTAPPHSQIRLQKGVRGQQHAPAASPQGKAGTQIHKWVP
jgi:hypothetical protein